jgi:hypothetical protein
VRDSPDRNAAATSIPAIGIAAAIALVLSLLSSILLLFGFINVSGMIWNLTISVHDDGKLESE